VPVGHLTSHPASLVVLTPIFLVPVSHLARVMFLISIRGPEVRGTAVEEGVSRVKKNPSNENPNNGHRVVFFSSFRIVSMGTESTPCIVFTGVKKNLAYCCG